ncbi:MAG TPA: UDP-N-acetylglucosamine 2-epimerase (non-hydrolyzing) [Gaiellaceae bacterium]|nr:UDP-N-acetylglucosamine 2-epimerase (non-hydrolyzing) [Gaiellaceae bacterium]
MKLLTVVGNRPQFVKSAPLSRAFRDAGIEEVVVRTGQHYDTELSQVFFEELGLSPPHHDLGAGVADVDAMRPLVARAIRAEHPDLTVVLGDTNSTLAGAEAAAETGVPVAHVEAGMRCGDASMTEERNRITVDRLSAHLFAPDEHAGDRLREERADGEVAVVGDVMADALRLFRDRAAALPPRFAPGTYALATVHREANVRPLRLGRILQGLGRLDVRVVLPAHPRTRAAIGESRLDVPSNVLVISPLGYLELTAVAMRARVIVTDSGGLQKEAYWHGVPCVTTRSTTEWTATVDAGANVLVDDDPDAIATAAAAARMPAQAPPLYGDGHASERIAAYLAARMRGR